MDKGRHLKIVFKTEHFVAGDPLFGEDTDDLFSAPVKKQDEVKPEPVKKQEVEKSEPVKAAAEKQKSGTQEK